jgi:RHS repeat-associated protein
MCAAGGVTSAFVWDISSPANVLSDSANAYVYDGSLPIEQIGTGGTTWFVHLRSRYYDPAIAVFLTVDPLSDISGTPYAYDNPLNRVDPHGQWSILGAIAGGLPAGAAPSGLRRHEQRAQDPEALDQRRRVHP